MLLCFKCGSLKPGSPATDDLAAIYAPCSRCGFGSSGDAELDIIFSDANMSHKQLSFFGSVVKAIQTVSDDDVAVFWSFIRYVSSHYPQILTKTVPSLHLKRVENVYDQVEWPDSAAEPDQVSAQPLGQRKRWW